MKKIVLLFMPFMCNIHLYSIDRVDDRSKLFLTNLRVPDDNDKKNLLTAQEQSLANSLLGIEKKQSNAVHLTINMNEDTTLIELFAIQHNLEEEQKEHKALLRKHAQEKNEIKKLSPEFELYEKELLNKIDLLHIKIKNELNKVHDFITARNLALNSNYSVKEAVEALQFINKTQEHFENTVVRKITAQSTPLLNYHYDVFYENPSQVKDARDRFAQLIKDNQTFIASSIAKSMDDLMKKYGKNERLHNLLQEKLSTALSEIASLTATLKAIADKLEQRVQHEAAEQA